MLDEWTKTAWLPVSPDAWDMLSEFREPTFRTILVSMPPMKWRVEMRRVGRVVETWTFTDRAKAALHVEAIKALEGVK